MLWIALIALYFFVALAFCIALGVAAKRPVPLMGVEAQQAEPKPDMSPAPEQRSLPMALDESDVSCLLHDKYAGLQEPVALGETPAPPRPPAEDEETQRTPPARSSPVVFIQQSGS
jgi:hypothetical protein